jgi:hypothetical protein
MRRYMAGTTAMIVRIGFREIEIIWNDGSIGRIKERDLKDFDINEKNYSNELNELLGLIK